MSGIIGYESNLFTYSSVENSYIVNTPLFEGPLDLLLYLIEKAELDITKLSLASVTDQYLEYLGMLLKKDTQEVSSFLVIASRLLQIKSELLLPQPVSLSPEEDLGESLTRQLLEYKKIKKVSELLLQINSSNYRTYLRTSAPIRKKEILDLTNFTVYDLKSLLMDVLAQEDEKNDSGSIEFHKVSIKDKIQIITNKLTHQGMVSFLDFLRNEDDWVDVVVIFLAVLELMKQRWIIVSQEKLFGEMVVKTAEMFSDVVGVVSEFDEI